MKELTRRGLTIDKPRELEYFSLTEFTCKCGCGENLINRRFVERLDDIRVIYYPAPLVVSSGFRCPKHDAELGGKGNHPTGRAADLLVPKGADLYEFARALIALNLPRIIFYHDKPHVHVDMIESKPQGIFVY